MAQPKPILSAYSYGIKELGDKFPSSLPSPNAIESNVYAPALSSHGRKVFW